MSDFIYSAHYLLTAGKSRGVQQKITITTTPQRGTSEGAARMRSVVTGHALVLQATVEQDGRAIPVIYENRFKLPDPVRWEILVTSGDVKFGGSVDGMLSTFEFSPDSGTGTAKVFLHLGGAKPQTHDLGIFEIVESEDELPPPATESHIVADHERRIRALEQLAESLDTGEEDEG